MKFFGKCLFWFVLGKDVFERVADEFWLRIIFFIIDFDRRFVFVILVGSLDFFDI